MEVVQVFIVELKAIYRVRNFGMLNPDPKFFLNLVLNDKFL